MCSLSNPPIIDLQLFGFARCVRRHICVCERDIQTRKSKIASERIRERERESEKEHTAVEVEDVACLFVNKHDDDDDDKRSLKKEQVECCLYRRECSWHLHEQQEHKNMLEKDHGHK